MSRNPSFVETCWLNHKIESHRAVFMEFSLLSKREKISVTLYHMEIKGIPHLKASSCPEHSLSLAIY
jgi:hypothetical protein